MEVILKYGPGWKLIDENAEDNTIQTHTAYPDAEGTYVFAHPFSYNFVCEEVFDWPKFIFKVWRVDQFGKIDCISYGTSVLPNMPGTFEFETATWRPMGSLMDEAHSFYLGGPPKFTTLNPLTKQLTL